MVLRVKVDEKTTALAGIADMNPTKKIQINIQFFTIVAIINKPF